MEVCSALVQETQAVKASRFTPDRGSIVVSVRLARSLEEILIPQEGLRLTKLFEESHRRAGREGDFLFMVSLVVMTLVSYIVACFSFGASLKTLEKSRLEYLARVVDHAASFLVLLKNGHGFFSANVLSN